MTAAPVTAPPAAVGGVSRGRVLTFAGVVFYATAFLVAYRISAVPRYDYFGLGDRPIGGLGVIGLILLAALPAVWVPVRLVRPSQILYWTLYLLVYVPALFLAFFSSLPRVTVSDALLLDLTLAGAMVILGLGYHVPLPKLRSLRVGSRAIQALLFGVGVALFTVLLLTAGRILQFVHFADVGTQREAFVAATAGSFGRYAFAWLAAVIDPLLIAIGIVRKRWSLILIGVAGQVLLYAAAGAKGVLLSVPMFPALALLLRWRRLSFGGIMASAIGLLALLAPLADLIGARLVAAGVTFIVLFRSLGIPGLAVTQYFAFFEHHPHTYGSHITGLSWLMHYPYPRTLDYTIGQYYYNSAVTGLNANLWAGDGLAAFGLGGVLLVSLLCAVVFWTLDVAAEGLDIRFTVLALGYGVVNFSNVSLFTNLLTGGIGLLILLFWLWPRGPAWTRDD